MKSIGKQFPGGEGLQCDLGLQPGLKKNCTKNSENYFFGKKKKRKYSTLNMSTVTGMLNGSCLSVLPFSGAEILPEAPEGMAQQATVAVEQESGQRSRC